MKREILKSLPSEIIVNIFSRLHLRAVARSKCVCKPWLHLLESKEFVSSHLAKSVSSLAVLTATMDICSCTISEFEEGDDLESHDLHYNQLTRFDFPYSLAINGSAHGLLFLFKESEVYWVCNPITRNYIEVRFPDELIRPYPRKLNYPEFIEENVYSYPHSVTYGFGVSKISGEFKVVRIFHDSVIVHGGPAPTRIIPKSECHVYTLGTGSWRRVDAGAGAAVLEYSSRASCVFLNGNLHWEDATVISGLSALGDSLCLCDHTAETETAIWLMREYGDEKSWSKEYEDRRLFYYSSKTGATREIHIFPAQYRINSILLTPSFLSLKSFELENAISF